MKKSAMLLAVISLIVGGAIGYVLANSGSETGQTLSLDPPENYTGLWEVKDSNGRLMEIKTYRQGQLHGSYVNWYGNGNLHWVYNFWLGEPKGRQITFDKQGEILDSSLK